MATTSSRAVRRAGRRESVGGGAVVVGVTGARGGIGASTFAALLAGRLAARTATVLVDLAGGAGLDVLLGCEDVPGPRWPDLAGAGDLPGVEVLAALPRWGACALVSADRLRPDAVEAATVGDLLAAVMPCAGAVVLDLDRTDVAARRAPLDGCDLVVVVTGRDLACVGGAVALRPALTAVAGRAGLAVRGGRGLLSVTEVEQAVALPVLCRVPGRRALAADVERGALSARGRAGRVAGRMADAVLARAS